MGESALATVRVSGCREAETQAAPREHADQLPVQEPRTAKRGRVDSVASAVDVADSLQVRWTRRAPGSTRSSTVDESSERLDMPSDPSPDDAPQAVKALVLPQRHRRLQLGDL